MRLTVQDWGAWDITADYQESWFSCTVLSTCLRAQPLTPQQQHHCHNAYQHHPPNETLRHKYKSFGRTPRTSPTERDPRSTDYQPPAPRGYAEKEADRPAPRGTAPTTNATPTHSLEVIILSTPTVSTRFLTLVTRQRLTDRSAHCLSDVLQTSDEIGRRRSLARCRYWISKAVQP